MKLLLALWVAVMGIAPFSWPEHTDWRSPWMWADWTLHIGAAVYIVAVARRNGHRKIGDVLQFWKPDKEKEPKMPPTEYHATLVWPDGRVVNMRPIVSQTSFRHAHLVNLYTDDDVLKIVLNDDPDGPVDDPEGHLIASFDRVGSAIWLDDRAEVIYNHRG